MCYRAPSVGRINYYARLLCTREDTMYKLTAMIPILAVVMGFTCSTTHGTRVTPLQNPMELSGVSTAGSNGLAPISHLLNRRSSAPQADQGTGLAPAEHELVRRSRASRRRSRTRPPNPSKKQQKNKTKATPQKTKKKSDRGGGKKKRR